MSFVTDTQAPAVLFPGQGSQTPEMRDHVARLAPDLLERVTELVGEDPFPRVEESTRFAQPAIFCASITAYDALGLEPGVAAGHSLGELAALAAAGVLDRDAALELVVLRGRLMAEADDTGSMLALVGATEEEAREIAAHAGVTVANDNAPGQVVLSGTREALALAEEDARDHGRRALKLNVAGAFHSPLMEPAVAPFTEALASTAIGEPRFPVVSCATTQPFSDVRAELAAALTSPVRWRETMLALARRPAAPATSRSAPARCWRASASASSRTARRSRPRAWSPPMHSATLPPDLRTIAREATRNGSAFAPQRTASIIGLGHWSPAEVVPNSALAGRLGVDDAWIVKRTGVQTRRRAAPNERLSDMATWAARRALSRRRRRAQRHRPRARRDDEPGRDHAEHGAAGRPRARRRARRRDGHRRRLLRLPRRAAHGRRPDRDRPRGQDPRDRRRGPDPAARLRRPEDRAPVRRRRRRGRARAPTAPARSARSCSPPTARSAPRSPAPTRTA